MKKNQVINIGLVGLGGMANGHLYRLENISSLKVNALCDVNEEALRQFGEKAGVSEENRYTDMEEMISSDQVDAVISVVPNNLHAEVLKLCIQYQKPIFAEKPFTYDLSEADELLEIYERNPIPCTVSFIHRYTPSFQYAKALLTQNKIGKIRHIDVRYLQSFGAPTAETPYLWRFDKSVAGTGALGDLGSHMIDTARYFIGEFKTVTATMKTFVENRKDPVTGENRKVEVDDYASFMATLENDIPGHFITTRNALGSENQHEVTLYGDEGTIYVNIERPNELDIFVKDASDDKPSWKTLEVPESYTKTLHHDFAELIINKENPNCPSFYDGYINQKILDVIMQSAETGKMFTIE